MKKNKILSYILCCSLFLGGCSDESVTRSKSNPEGIQLSIAANSQLTDKAANSQLTDEAANSKLPDEIERTITDKNGNEKTTIILNEGDTIKLKVPAEINSDTHEFEYFEVRGTKTTIEDDNPSLVTQLKNSLTPWIEKQEDETQSTKTNWTELKEWFQTETTPSDEKTASETSKSEEENSPEKNYIWTHTITPEDMEYKRIIIIPNCKPKEKTITVKCNKNSKTAVQWYYRDSYSNKDPQEIHDNKISFPSTCKSPIVEAYFDNAEYECDFKTTKNIRYYDNEAPKNKEYNKTYTHIVFSDANPEDNTYTLDLKEKVQWIITPKTNTTISVISKRGKVDLVDGKYKGSDVVETEIYVIANGRRTQDDIQSENLSFEKEEATNTQTTFTYKIKDDRSVQFDPEVYQKEHGKIEYYYYDTDGNRKDITKEENLNNGEKIYYKVKPDDNYFFDGNDSDSFTLDDYYKAKLNKFVFRKENQDIDLTEIRNVNGGTIRVFVNSEEYTEDTLKYNKDNKNITIKIEPAPGYKFSEDFQNALEDKPNEEELECIVKEESDYLWLNVSNHDLTPEYCKGIFVETEEHKSHVKVTLDKSVGTELKFIVTANNEELNKVEEQNQKETKEHVTQYNKKIGDATIVDRDAVPMAAGIRIEISNGQLEPQHAIKMKATYKPNNGEKKTEIRYIGKIGLDSETSFKLPDERNYEEVVIQISKVADVAQYHIKKYPNIEKYYIELNGRKIEENEYIENNAKIQYTIETNGKKDQGECKFKDLDKKLQKYSKEAKS